MTALDREFEQELARLSAAFVAELPRKIQSVSDDITVWLTTPQESGLYERLSHKVHQLKGAGSTFGCPGISDAARALEQELADIQAATPASAGLARQEAAAAIRRLQDEAARLQEARAGSGRGESVR